MKHIKKKSAKLLSLVLCGAMAFGMVGAGAYAAGAKKGSTEETKEASEEKADNTGAETSTAAGEASREETVYVIAGADGSAKKIIVSDWIKDRLSENQTESYTMNEDEAEKELPVDLSVSYKLDGKTVSAEELAGKSGKVTMRFDYTNKQYEEVEIDGVKQKVYVPFVMLTGMILDNESFSNVEVSNGRLINDGNHTVVIGFALPGLQSNLDIDKEKLELPEYVEITADVKEFELSTTMTLATNEVFSDIDLKDADTLDELDESLGKLTDAMDQLMDGSSALYEGLSTLLDKSGDLISGIDQLAAGAGALSSGADTLKAGTDSLRDGTNSLHAGASELNSGLNQLVSNNDALNGGAKQVFDSLLQMANEQLAASGLSVPKLTADNYASVLEGAIGSLDENTIRNIAYNKALETVTAKVRENTVAISTQVEAAVREQVIAGVLAAAGNPMSVEQYQAILNGAPVDEATQAAAAQISAAVEAQMNSDDIRNTISATTEAKVQELISQNMQSSEVTSQINAAVESAKSGATSIAALKSQLDSYNQFYQGLLTYTSGVASAKTGSDQLVSGAAQLQNGAARLSDGAASLSGGAAQLSEGISKLQSGSGALVDGVEQLKDGAMQLSDGLKEFNEEGIEKLVDAFDGNLKGLVNRLRATVDVSKNYKSFAGDSDDMGGDVKFIYKTDGIEAE